MPESAPPAIDHELIWGSLALGMLAVARLPEHWLLTLPVVCPFRRVTGLPCMLCGGTHAMQAFVRGNWGAAWNYNPLAVLIGAGAVLYACYAIGARIAGRPWRPAVQPRWAARGAVIATLAIAALNWAYLIRRAL